MPDYKTKHYAAALQAEKRGIAESKKARTANRHSNDYLLLTVMFASVLFFAGIATKFSSTGVKVSMLSLGLVIFVGSIVLLSLQP